ncbi:hypothetical protein GYMLUDRAFT_244137 [Collybiopsis luxurians FD-317 M1]|uniref:Uncharacterized protein n=1 Tax=Collybiopsis luxurians FD-317 M1 TaxID=944289 RepID=A0A0D0CDL2_9AGAR|nr:hypothetical protein GYMLUDRAFT_244137 [Collybiopsis luxurians FD-317 M1]
MSSLFTFFKMFMAEKRKHRLHSGKTYAKSTKKVIPWHAYCCPFAPPTSENDKVARPSTMAGQDPDLWTALDTFRKFKGDKEGDKDALVASLTSNQMLHVPKSLKDDSDNDLYAQAEEETTGGLQCTAAQKIERCCLPKLDCSKSKGKAKEVNTAEYDQTIDWDNLDGSLDNETKNKITSSVATTTWKCKCAILSKSKNELEQEGNTENGSKPQSESEAEVVSHLSRSSPSPIHPHKKVKVEYADLSEVTPNFSGDAEADEDNDKSVDTFTDNAVTGPSGSGLVWAATPDIENSVSVPVSKWDPDWAAYQLQHQVWGGASKQVEF